MCHPKHVTLRYKEKAPVKTVEVTATSNDDSDATLPAYTLSERRAHVNKYRCLYVAAAVFALMKRKTLDKACSDAWQWLCRQRWFLHDSFEPVEATVAFGVWHWVWYLVDKLGSKGLKRSLLNPKGRDTSWSEWEAWEGVHKYAATAYLAPLLAFDYFFPRRRLPKHAPTFLRLVGGVAAGVWLYDLIFYPLHLAMHKVQWLNKYHRAHHTNSPLIAPEILRHSLVDGSLQVLANILTLNILRLHPMTRAVYNIVVTYLLTEAHSGYDFGWMLHNVIPFGLLGGSQRHEKHHRTGRHNYHQFFTYLDNMLGYGSDFNESDNDQKKVAVRNDSKSG